MPSDYKLFQQSLTLFHKYSQQNNIAVKEMLSRDILPSSAVLDIGAGEGHLPDLMREHISQIVLVEPNPECVKVLQNKYEHVYPSYWDESIAGRIRKDFTEGFSLITMSHMLYHLGNPDNIRSAIRMAFGLLKSQGYLVIIINAYSAPTAQIGMKFLSEEGRTEELNTNLEIHTFCHDINFYKQLAIPLSLAEICSLNTPFEGVENREELIALFRMPLLDPLSKSCSNTKKLDEFIDRELKLRYPSLEFPAAVPSSDDMIILQKA